jgi:Fur family ferric uptake transcriptional regulator
VHIQPQDLVDALRSAGLRATATRRAVCEIVAAHHSEHLTPASITERLEGRADQSTVYRTLEALESAGILRHTHLGHGPAVYHLADEPPHQHLVCRSCGTTIEIAADDLTHLLEAITARSGFVPDPAHFGVSGLCAKCAAVG